MADIDTDLVILALAMAVSQKSDLSGFGDNSLNFDSNLVLGSLFLSVVKSVINHFIVKI